MSHKVDMNKYKIRTNLAVDSIKIDKKDVKKINNINVIDINIDDKKASLIGRKKGNYVTIEFEDITDSDNYEKVKEVLIKQLKKIINLKDNDKCLVIGLGNELLLPDSLGPKVTKQIIVTEPIYKFDNLDNKYRRVSIFNPSVYGVTGVETTSIVSSVIDTVKPNLVIVIDSLMSKSINRINKTIQITDAGISPGSGIGYTKEISKDILGIPIISIGIPTVLDVSALVDEIVMEIPNIDDELVNLINQKLDLYNLMITSNDLDYLMKKFSNLLAFSLNEIFHS